MATEHTDNRSLQDEAPESLESPGHQDNLEEDQSPPQTLRQRLAPSRSTSSPYIDRPRTGQSPFFAGSRQNYRPRGISTPSTRHLAPVAPTAPEEAADLESFKFPETTTLVSQEPPASNTSAPAVLRNQSCNLQVCSTPRRVIRADDSWKTRTRSPTVPFFAGTSRLGPPPVPARSPLRLVTPPSRSTSSAVDPSPATHSQLAHSYEDRALWEELSPPPLLLRKLRTPETPPPPTPGNRRRRTQAPPEAQAILESPGPDRSRSTEELILKRILATEKFTEANKALLAVRVEEEFRAKVLADRQDALEILESSPEPAESDPRPPRYKVFQKRRRVGATFGMESLHPDSAAAMSAHRHEAVRLAEVQQRAVIEKCKRSKESEPDYIFDELIGKGSFGRVYKGRQRSTNKVVAIKVLDIDEADFRAYGDQKDEQIRDFNREIRILRQAQESGAENLNQMIEALPVHSQLWLICDFCPGGSVKTLMRATNDRLSEKYIVVVARELAKALKGLHEAGIMHRDVKAANVLIHQEGHLELCDFGVATVLDTSTDKRKTFIGTLHWMPPELWTENPEYSDEVDVWEYGCTLYECAMGRPPNSDLRERQQLKMRMRRLKQAISLPENEGFSDGLRSLVSYALSPDVASRPSMKEILEHEYLKDTEETHPTNTLTELVQTYYAWLMSGGQRVSLFMPGGAAAASTSTQDSGADVDPMDEWNFSMTQDFERRVSAILEIPDFSNLSTSETTEGEETPKGSTRPSGLSPPKEMTTAQKANFEARVKRGADLSNLFDQNKPAYEYKTKTDFVPIPEQRRISDLPFRAMAEDRPSSIASNVIDLGDFDEADYAVAAPRTDDKIQTAYAATPMREETIRLADASTLREKRANSKGPRDPNSQSLTARRASSVEDRPSGTSTQDFAISQEEWTVKSRKAPELQEPAEITSSRHPGHATMDWSFASAMSEAAIPQINVPDAEDSNSGLPGPEASEDELQKSKKHATMDWSFSAAMAEASATGTTAESIRSSPPTRPTPTRPAPLVRQMTMPVTIGDFAQAEEQEIPRPSTALSEAYSDVSASSTDVDPFGLERDDDGDYPGPATMDEDVGSSGMGGFYSGRGRTMIGERADGAYAGFADSTTSTPLTASGPGPYSLGRPARIGEDGFPGPSSSLPTTTAATLRASSASVASNATATGAPRPVVDVPPASPPSSAVMGAYASNDEVEAELTRLLEAMQGTLNAAREVVGGLERRRDREEEDEWVDED